MKWFGSMTTGIVLLGTLTSGQVSSVKKRDTGAASYTNNLGDASAGSYSSNDAYYPSGQADYGHDSYYGGQESNSKGGFDLLSLFGPIFAIKGKILEAVGQLIISKGNAIAEIGQKLKDLDTKGNQGGYPAAKGGYPGPSSGGKGKGKGSSGSYGAPKAPSSQYGTPNSGKGKGSKKPSSSYGSPSKPSGSYGTPKKPSGSYGIPSKPSGSYGTPHVPSSSYGQPPASYGAPQPSLSADYGAPQSSLSSSYGTGPSSVGSTYSGTAGGDYSAGLQAPQPNYVGTSNTLATSYNTVPPVQSIDNTQTYVSNEASSGTGSTYFFPQAGAVAHVDTANYANTQDLSSYSSGTAANSAYDTSINNLNAVAYASDVQQVQPAIPVAPASYGGTSVALPAPQGSSVGNGYSGVSYSESSQPVPLSSYGSNTVNSLDTNSGYSDQASAYSELLVRYAKQQKQLVPPIKVVTNNASQLVKSGRYSPLIGYGLQEWHPVESKSNLNSTFNPLFSVVIPTATNTTPSSVKVTPKAEVLSSAPKDNSTLVPKKKDLANGGKFPLQTIATRKPPVS